MKKIYTMKRILSVALIAIGSIMPAAAYNNVWVKAEAYPTGAGTVYVSNYPDEEDVELAEVSEFKRSTNAAPSTAFIWAEPADDYQLAGFARDNGNYVYDNGVDEQIKVRYDRYFTAVYDPTEYGSAGASSQAEQEAKEALENMENPTDYIFAVFTQGAVARVAEGHEGRGYVFANKLTNNPGDKVMFSAFGDSNSDEGVKYYRFSHWSNEMGETISTNRFLTVTVEGMDVYYANFTKTTSDDFRDNEKYQPFPEDNFLPGDVNLDNAVDVADISSILSVMANGTNDSVADVNKDGFVDVADISSVLTIMAEN